MGISTRLATIRTSLKERPTSVSASIRDLLPTCGDALRGLRDPARYETSVRSVKSIQSVRSMFSYVSAGSFASALSMGSAFSVGSIGSAFSAGSILSLNSCGSLLSVNSVGSVLSVNSCGTVLSWNRGAVSEDPPVLDAVDTATG